MQIALNLLYRVGELSGAEMGEMGGALRRLLLSTESFG